MKFSEIMQWAVLVVAAVPFFYYLIAIYSAWRFFRRPAAPRGNFTPPVSILKPVRGLDAAAYANFASFCEQDYPEYEMLFCVGDADDPVIPVVGKLAADFPRRSIRVLIGSNRSGSNDKVAKLCRLASEARHDVLVLSDSDIRVTPSYLRTVVAPLQDPQVGAVTCLYLQTDEKTLADHLQAIGQVSDFYAGVLVARQLDGMKFALGSTIVVTRERLAETGGFEALENRVADDLQVGRRIAEKGYRVELDERGMTLNAKIREAQLNKVPFTLVVGDKEVEQGAVSPRRYGGEDLKSMPLPNFEALLAREAALP